MNRLLIPILSSMLLTIYACNSHNTEPKAQISGTFYGFPIEILGTCNDAYVHEYNFKDCSITYHEYAEGGCTEIQSLNEKTHCAESEIKCMTEFYASCAPGPSDDAFSNNGSSNNNAPNS